MKRLVLCLQFCLLAGSVRAQEVITEAVPEPITIGQKYSLSSEILGEERAYWVYLPASYQNTTYAPQNYPVLYLLDGDAHFQSASGVVQFMGQGPNGNLQIPELIIVAIPNTDRTRDLTPTATDRAYNGEERPLAGGGGDEFLTFIRDELFPEIESRYRTRPYRIFVGHSLGGLLALHALVDVPDMFQSHIAIDPSLWWDQQTLLRRAESYFAETQGLHGAVYISSANNAAAEPGAPNVMLETAEAFALAVETGASPGLRAEHRYFEAEDHGSVPLLSLYHGLLHVFDGYKPSVAALLDGSVADFADHFERVSVQLGLRVSPPEPFVDQIGGYLIGTDLDKAIELFELNVSNFPQSSNAHSSLGGALLARGDLVSAAASLEKSLELNPDNNKAQEGLRTIARSQSEVPPRGR